MKCEEKSRNKGKRRYDNKSLKKEERRKNLKRIDESDESEK